MSISSVCKENGINLNDRRKVSMGGNEWRNISRITHICRHHSGVNVDQSMQILEGYWKNAHGWNTGGYHVVIHFNGDVDLNYDYGVISNGVGNHNSYTFHISVLGNGKFTPAQEKSFKVICKEVQKELNIPTRNVWGHNDFSGHAYNSCPGINMNIVRKALDSNNAAPGSNVKPDTNLKPIGKTIKVGTQAKQWQTGSDIPKFVIGGVYDVLQEKTVNQSKSKKAYLIGKGKAATGWLLEQDVDGFKTLAPVKPAPAKSIDTLVKETLAGDHSDGDARKKSLGSNYNAVMNVINGVGSNPAPKPKYNLPTGVYRVSNPMRHGNDVLQIQLALSSIYFYPNKGGKNNGCDSWYGNDTANAVKRFQSVHGLVADGVYGDNTRKKLHSLVN